MKKYTFFLLLLLVIIGPSINAQNDKCSKPRVAVYLNQIDDDPNVIFIEWLNSHYPFKPEAQWLSQIQTWVIEELRQNSPDIIFVNANGSAPDDCEFRFKYILGLTGGGESYEVRPGVETSEYTAYDMSGNFGTNPHCGFNSRIIDINITKDRDLHAVIKKNIAAFGKISDLINEHERTHLVPPRGIEMEVSKKKDYVSPLEGHQSLDIKIDIKNCKGEIVYDKDHGQLVFLPRKIPRGENEPTKKFPQNQVVTENIVTLIIVRPQGASATYWLRRGINADKEKIKIKSCGLDDEVLKETTIPIHGLEIKVKPNRKNILHDQKTDIIISFNEIWPKDKALPNGKTEPVPGKKLNVKVSGLIDGKVTPVNNYITDKNGKVKLTYHAGKKDKKITITASYQPANYPDKAVGHSSVNVKEFKWYGNLTMIGTMRNKCTQNVQKDLTLQQTHINILAKHIDVSQPMIAINLGDLVIDGSIYGKYEYVYEEEGGNDNHYKHVIENMHGQKVFPITNDNLLEISIISDKLTDQNAVKQMAEMAKKVASGKYNEKEIEKIASQMEKQMDTDQKSYPVTVIILLRGNWRGKISIYEYIHETDNGEVVEDKESNDVLERDLIPPIGLELKGTLTKKDNGEIIIRASVHKDEATPQKNPCSINTTNADFTIKRVIE